MKYWQTRKFNQLHDEWYEKLKSKGFVDQEKKIGSKYELIQQSSNVYRQASDVIRENKIAYFDLLQEHIAKDIFSNEVHKVIMERRALGFKIKEIVSTLEELGLRSDRKTKNIDRKTIRYIIRNYEHKWKIRYWTKDQLDPNLKKKKTPTR